MKPRSLRYPDEGGASSGTAVGGNKRSLPLTTSELNPDNDPDMSKRDATSLGEAVDRAVKGNKNKMSEIRRKAFHASPPKDTGRGRGRGKGRGKGRGAKAEGKGKSKRKASQSAGSKKPPPETVKATSKKVAKPEDEHEQGEEEDKEVDPYLDSEEELSEEAPPHALLKWCLVRVSSFTWSYSSLTLGQGEQDAYDSDEACVQIFFKLWTQTYQTEIQLTWSIHCQEEPPRKTRKSALRKVPTAKVP